MQNDNLKFKMIRKLPKAVTTTLSFALLILNSAFASYANAVDLPAGKPITFNEVNSLIQYIAQFIVIMAILLAFIVFIISGITYMTAAGSNDKVKKAQAIFKNGIWGTLIMLSVGVIINTLAGVVTRDFFCSVGIGGVCFY